MSSSVRVVGVHPVKAAEPVHLIEIEITGPIEEFDFGEVTQNLANQPKDNWQVPWDERELSCASGCARFAFFFHYLQLDKPLLTPFGPVQLPSESPIPGHLRNIKYEPP